MRLLLDANLSWRLVKTLSEHYPSITHITDVLSHNAHDFSIWQFAQKEEFVIVTNDEDFIGLMADKGWPPKIILLKTGNQSNNFLANLLIQKKEEIITFFNHPTQGMLVIY